MSAGVHSHPLDNQSNPCRRQTKERPRSSPSRVEIKMICRLMLCPELLLLPLDGETIAFSEATQHLFSLNPTAALVVEKLQKGRGVSEIAQLIAERGLAAPEQASEWVDATLAALKEQMRVAEAAATPADPDGISDLLPYSPFKPVTEQRYCLLETCALIRYEAWAQKRLVESVLGHLATDEPRAPTVVIELKAEKRANYTMRSDVYRDGVPVASARGLSFLGPIVKGAIWQAAVSAHDFFSTSMLAWWAPEQIACCFPLPRGAANLRLLWRWFTGVFSISPMR